MRRFILIDPSITDWTGHCGEYAFRMLNAAKSQGFEPILLTHHHFDKTQFNDLQIHSCYRWGGEVLPPLFQWLYRFLKIKNVLSANFRHDNFSEKKMTSKGKVKSAIKLFLNQKQSAQFVKETVRALKEIQVTADDIIFIPNALYYVLVALVQIFKKNESNLQWHLVFHFEFHELISEPRSGLQHEKLARKLLTELKNHTGKNKLNLYADTQQLTDYYNRFNIISFSPVPIPVDSSYTCQSETNKFPLQVSYIGAARSNKGFHYLPQLVNTLKDEKIIFSIQSNLNRLEGDVKALAAKKKLEEMRGEKIKLLDSALTPDEYKTHVLSSDIVLIPYDAEEYINRSSGIFAECMSAGIPVVVPEGSWMAVQLKNAIDNYKFSGIENTPKSVVGVIYQDPCELSDAVREIIQHYTHYKNSAVSFAKEWARYHNPISLLEVLNAKS